MSKIAQKSVVPMMLKLSSQSACHFDLEDACSGEYPGHMTGQFDPLDADQGQCLGVSSCVYGHLHLRHRLTGPGCVEDVHVICS